MSPTLPKKTKQIVLNERPPRGPITDKTFRVETSDIPEVQDGELLVQITYTSIDPTQRGWLDDVRSYLPPVELGAVMRAGTVGRVLVSKADGFKEGDLVTGYGGWQEYWVGPAKQVQKAASISGASDRDFLGMYGMVGMTAYIGLFEVGKLKDGDNVVISGAAGAVGLIASQIVLAHPKCTLSVIAGSEEKLQELKKLGAHKVFNYKDADFKKKFRKEVGYVDVYFDNVGGEILDLVLGQLNPYARIIACGAIASYNSEKPVPVYNTFALVSQKSTMRGFIVTEHVNLWPEGQKYLAKLNSEGKLKYEYHELQGLENTITALREMFSGKNFGKTVVRIAPQDKSKL